MYSIAAAADVTGVCQETIRHWEHSYGVVRPRRTTSGQRRYHDDDLRALTAMASLVDVGWRPAEAAVEARDRTRALGAVRRAAPPALTVAKDDLTTTLLAAAQRLHGPTISDVLDSAWEYYGRDDVADAWLMPMLTQLGSHWQEGSVSVAGEHLASDLVRCRLMCDYEDAMRRQGPPGRPTVLVGVAHGVGHDLGARAFAALLARGEVPVTYLSGVPDTCWQQTVRALGTRHVVLAVPRAHDAVPTARLAERIRVSSPGVVVHVGGGYQHLAPPPLRTLGHHLGTAADALALTVACDGLGAVGA